MEKVNITIIGAGIIGLAIASKLSEKYSDILILDKHENFGQETSSRNSEVIHAGIYYPTNTLKANLCVEGNEKLYKYCSAKNIPHKKIGKLIVATDKNEEKELQKLEAQGKINGVYGLKILTQKETTSLEPAVSAIAALYSPNTGILDTHSLMKYLYQNSLNKKVTAQFNSEVTKITKSSTGYEIHLEKENYSFETNICINAAGLYSDIIANFL
ncbi:MAG: FAD-dependent oxidoreductase, partial [Candidatus Margulisbacteria bacterium]|nr:FAD-dependent oxidoreductase [Candidatus Margulisiibacteriota bacterium]